MKRIDLEKLRIFYEIARAGNMTRAANILNITQSAVSKSFLLFERRLKKQLFDRVHNGMRLTQEGEELYIFAKKLFGDQDIFENHFFEKEEDISGDLRIQTYPFIGSELLLPNLEKFIRNYLDVNIKIRLVPENLNPSQADITLASYIPYQPNLIQKPLFSARTQLFASKDYLKKHGIPQKPEDLNNHRLITYRGDHYSSDRSINLVLHVGLKQGQPLRKSNLEIDSLRGMINAALLGYGIVDLPNYPLVKSAGLERILPEIEGEDITLYYIFLENRKNSKKINKLYEYLGRTELGSKKVSP